MHHLRASSPACAADIPWVLRRLPKKITGELANELGERGYGMLALSGWVLWKFILALAMSQLAPLPFAIRWLMGHPGDLQNALQVQFYCLGVLSVVVVLPDLMGLRRMGEDT
jgi:hypothetical protein